MSVVLADVLVSEAQMARDLIKYAETHAPSAARAAIQSLGQRIGGAIAGAVVGSTPIVHSLFVTLDPLDQT